MTAQDMSARAKARRRKAAGTSLLSGIPLVIFSCFILLPILWALSISFKDNGVVLSGQFSILPNPFTFENYAYVWERNHFGQYFANSMLIAVVSVLLAVNLILWNAYALTRCEFRGKNVVVMALLMTSTVPVMLNLTSIYMLIRNVGLMDSRIAIILLNVEGNIAFNTLLMRGFMGGIPREIDEAAMIDGCNRFELIYKIILPVAKPGLVTVLIYIFVACWNEYLMSFILLSDRTKFPISIGLKYFIGEFTTDYASLAAGSMIALLPPMILFGYVQKHLVGGLSVGAIKA